MTAEKGIKRRKKQKKKKPEIQGEIKSDAVKKTVVCWVRE